MPSCTGRRTAARRRDTASCTSWLRRCRGGPSRRSGPSCGLGAEAADHPNRRERNRRGPSAAGSAASLCPKGAGRASSTARDGARRSPDITGSAGGVVASTLRLVDVPPGGVQLRLPHLRFDAKRGCDRIRRRVYADPRIRPMVAVVLMALSEFVDVRRKSWPKQDLVAQMVHTDRRRVSLLSDEAEKLGVLVKDRARVGGRCCYTFAESWVQWFRDEAAGDARVASKAIPELPLKQLSTEPSNRTTYVRPAEENPQPPADPVPVESDPEPTAFVFLPADDPRAFDADEGGDWWRDGRRACDTSPNTTED